MNKNNKNQTIKRQKFEAPLDQILHILNSTINTEYEQFFGNKKYIGWFNQQDKVVDAKIALCNLLDEVIELQKGDRIYIYSDGYSDQTGGPEGLKYSSGRIKEMLQTKTGVPIGEMRQAIHDDFNDWKGDEHQVDDILMIGIEHQ